MSTGAITGTPATSAAGDGARRSLRFARRQLLRALHSLSVVTTTTNGATDGTTFVASRLRTSTNTDRYKHWWWWPVSGGAVGELARVQAEDALSLTTGTLMVAPPFSTQIVSGVELEGSSLLPPIDDDGWTGVRSCLNNALREMWAPDRLSITGVTGQPSYSLSTYEEWLDPDAVLELRRQALDSTLNSFPAGTFDIVRDADGLTLEVAPTLPGADASTIEVFRPLDTFIKVGGVWASSTTGYVNDSDEALVNPDLLVTVALAHAYAALASGPDGGRYDELARRWRLKANVAKSMHLDHRQKRVGAGLGYGSGGYDAKSFTAMRDSW